MKNEKSSQICNAYTLSAVSGCSDENGASGNIFETEYQTALATTSDKSVVPKSALSETTAAETEETVTSLPAEKKSDEQHRLEQLIIEAAKNENLNLNGNETIQSPLFGDFDGDGINELVAVYGDQSEALFEDLCGGEVWFATGEKAEISQPPIAPTTVYLTARVILGKPIGIITLPRTKSSIPIRERQFPKRSF